MTGGTRTRAHELALALRDHLVGAEELARLHAYQISRDAMAAGAGLLEVVADHQEALAIVLSTAWTPEQSARWIHASAELLAESLGPFEMAYRGFREANTTLTRLNQNLELQIADRHQAAIIQSSADAIISRTLDGIITSWNAGAERMYGYTAAEMVGVEGAELIPPGREGELPSIVGGRDPDGTFGVYETQRVRKGGALLDVAVTISPIRDGSGTIVGSSAVARDVTQGKRAVEALRASEARKSAILESSLDCVIIIDHQGLVVEFNPTAEQVFGYGRAQAMGKSMAELIVPEAFRDAHRAGIAHFLATGEGPILGKRLELTGMRADGSEFPIELAITRVGLPGPPLFSGCIRDLTAQHEMRAGLVKSEERLRAILDNSPAIIWLTDAGGRFLVVNRRFEEANGFEPGSVTGRTPEELWPEEVARRHRAAELNVLSTGRPEQSEEVVARPDGDHTYLSVVFPLLDAAGAPSASAGIWTDVSASKREEVARRSLEDRVHQSERLESLGQLAGGVAHDFNNLLAVILNYAAFVAEETADNPAVAADVEQIRKAAARAARLTRQLLTFGRRDVVRAETLDLNEIVADVHNMLSRSIGEHIALIVDAGHPLPPIRADRGQMEQVLLNFAVNARDAMPKGGTLTIQTRMTDLGAGDARLEANATPGRYVELSVRDTGIGIDHEVATHIFEPFFTTKPKGEGTGLGLATVYGIVTEAGGNATVESEVGVGTTFRVLLPAAA
jgi:PAS domain S-box-containing protein